MITLKNIFFLITILLIFIECEESDNSPEVTKIITIGVIENESAVARKSSFMTAIDEINEAGGVLDGYTIVYDVRNQGTNEEAVSTANDILRGNNVVGFVTAWSSRSKIITEEVGAPNKMSVISNGSTADENTGLSPYFHRVAPPDRFQAKVLAFQAKERNIITVAIAIQKDDNYSEGLALKFKENFGEENITTEILFTANDPEMSTKIEQIYAASPDAVLLAIPDNEIFIPFLLKVEESTSIGDKSNFRFLLADAQQTENFLNQAPKSLIVGNTNDGNLKAFGTAPFPDINDLNYQHFTKQLKSRFELEPLSFTAHTYDIAYIYALAIERAAQEGNVLNDINAFRIAVNENIRKISRPDAGDPEVNPMMGWRNIKTIVQSGDVNYEGASGNCDINSEGDVNSNYNIYTVIDNGDGTFSFFTIDNVAP